LFLRGRRGQEGFLLVAAFPFSVAHGVMVVVLSVGVGMIDAGYWDSGAQSVIKTGCAWG
jgi:hypothetical protein